jgi:hypothetical protein
MQNIEGVLPLPQVRPLSEGEGFWRTVRQTASDMPARGNLVPGIQLATILRQHGPARRQHDLHARPGFPAVFLLESRRSVGGLRVGAVAR